jgi:photosystem II stability/assembly factor-like uncharacterized protein
MSVYFWKKFILASVCFLMLSSAAIAQGWTINRAKGSGDLVAVYFTSSEKGWVAGDNGYLAFTVDGGKTGRNKTSKRPKTSMKYIFATMTMDTWSPEKKCSSPATAEIRGTKP